MTARVRRKRGAPERQTSDAALAQRALWLARRLDRAIRAGQPESPEDVAYLRRAYRIPTAYTLPAPWERPR